MKRVIIGVALLLTLVPMVEGAPSVVNSGFGYLTHTEDFSNRDGSSDFGTLTPGSFADTQSVIGKYKINTGSGFSSAMDVSNQRWTYTLAGSGTAVTGVGYCATSTGCGGGSFVPIYQYSPCALANGNTPLASFDVDVTLLTAPATTTAGQTNSVQVGWNGGGQGNPNAGQVTNQAFFLFSWSHDTQLWTITPAINGNSAATAFGTSLGTVATGAVVHLTVAGVNCSDASATFSAGTTSTTVNAVNSITTASDGVFGSGIYIGQNEETAGHRGGVIAVDNVIIRSPATATTAGSFCPVPGDVDFGYNYVEGVSFESALPSDISLNDGYRFSANADNHDYLAKGWTSTVVTEVYTRFTIEAAADGEASIIRFVFSFVDPTPYLSGTAYTTAAKGDGETTASFANFIEVEFTEVGNDWRIDWQRGISGTVVQVGPSFLGFNPNTATSFTWRIDTNGVNGYAALTNEFGTDVLNVSVSNFGALAGDNIHQLWIVGESTEAETILHGPAVTVMNNNDGDWNSACIYFPEGDPSLIGSAGAAPNNPDVDPGDVVDNPPVTNPSNLTGPAQKAGNPLGDMVSFLSASWGFDWSWIIGALILGVALIPILIATHGNPIAGGVIIVIVTVANVKLGLWEEWSILLMIFLVVALAANRMFSRGNGEADAV
jgi:hypothetical protein